MGGVSQRPFTPPKYAKFRCTILLMFIDYKVVETVNGPALQAAVLALLAQGYQPIGGVSVAAVVSPQGVSTLFVQAMVK